VDRPFCAQLTVSRIDLLDLAAGDVLPSHQLSVPASDPSVAIKREDAIAARMRHPPQAQRNGGDPRLEVRHDRSRACIRVPFGGRQGQRVTATAGRSFGVEGTDRAED
jgi:hypothetical protein